MIKINIKKYFDFNRCFEEIIKDSYNLLELYKSEGFFVNKSGVSFGEELYDFILNEKYGSELILGDSEITQNEVRKAHSFRCGMDSTYLKNT